MPPANDGAMGGGTDSFAICVPKAFYSSDFAQRIDMEPLAFRQPGMSFRGVVFEFLRQFLPTFAVLLKKFYSFNTV